jgi:hypothetical protein
VIPLRFRLRGTACVRDRAVAEPFVPERVSTPRCLFVFPPEFSRSEYSNHDNSKKKEYSNHGCFVS